MAAGGMEAALLKAPAPSSRRGVLRSAAGLPGPGAALCSAPWLPCLEKGVGICCRDALAEGLCNRHDERKLTC